jgi:hypothetical protein
MRPTLLGLCATWCASATAAPPTKAEAAAALDRAVAFFATEVRAHGGYLWAYSGDLKLREGEGRDPGPALWVQPPGTPTVGLALLAAHAATGNPAALESARESALAMTRGQLRSGGWTYSVSTDPAVARRYAYRVGGNPKGRNVSTLDDNTTQEAVRFLLRLDRALGGKDAAVRAAADDAVASVVAAQYPNGGWPQGYDGPADPAGHPVVRAGYPTAWPRAWPGGDYWKHYTLNDHVVTNTVDVLFLAADLRGDAPARAAAVRGADFLLLAQMPDPQPAWAQQYDDAMHPVWARKFEPPAVSGLESQSALETLLAVYRRTGDRKYLEPVPRALAYLRKSLRPDGRLARFYELETNKPLYMTRDYQLTDTDADVPTHYGFVVPARLDAIEAEYEAALAGTPRPPAAPPSAGKVRAIIDGLDARGAWVETGKLSFHKEAGVIDVIRCQRFADNIHALAAYVAAAP